MKTAFQISVALLCLSVAALAVRLVIAVNDAKQAELRWESRTNALMADLEMEVDWLTRSVEAVATQSDKLLTSAQADLTRTSNGLLSLADSRTAEVLPRVDTALGIADRRLGELTASVGELRSDLVPIIDGATEIEAHADRTVTDLHPQLLGLIAASKVTAGEAAQTMRTVRDTLPTFVSQGQHIVANADTATLQFSGVATNLNRLTKPRWYDRLLGYGVTGATMWRDLNPATAVVTGITRTVIGQK